MIICISTLLIDTIVSWLLFQILSNSNRDPFKLAFNYALTFNCYNNIYNSEGFNTLSEFREISMDRYLFV